MAGARGKVYFRALTVFIRVRVVAGASEDEQEFDAVLPSLQLWGDRMRSALVRQSFSRSTVMFVHRTRERRATHTLQERFFKFTSRILANNISLRSAVFAVRTMARRTVRM